MSLYSIPPLVVGIFVLVVGLVTLLHNRKAKVNKTFFLVTLVVCWWLVGYAIVYSTPQYERALQWVRLLYVGVVFIPVASFHFVVTLTRRDSFRRAIPWVYVGGIVFAGMTRSSYFIAGLHEFFWGFQTKVGPLHNIFLVFFFAAMGMVFYVLTDSYRQTRKTTPLEATRIKYVLLSYGVSTWAAIDFIPHYGYEFYPMGFVFVLVHAIVTTYALIRHRLLDTNIALTRWMVISLLIALALGFPIWLGAALRPWLVRVFGANWMLLPAALCVVFTASVTHYLPRLWERVEQAVFPKRFASQKTLKGIATKLAEFTEAEKLCAFLAQSLYETMEVSHVAFLARADQAYDLQATHGFIEPRGPWRCQEDDAVIRWFRGRVPGKPFKSTEPLVYEELVRRLREVDRRSAATWIDGLLANVVEWMESCQASVIVPISYKNELLGLIVLGAKRTGHIFTQEDLDTLSVMSHQAAMALANMALHQRERAAEHQRLIGLGELLFAISHEFQNVLNVISLPLQVIATNLHDPELQQMVQRTTEDILRGKSITQAASAYRKKQETPTQRWDVSQIIRETLTQARQEQFAGSSPRFDVRLEVPNDVVVEGTATVPELFLNCLRYLGWACERREARLSITADKAEAEVKVRLTMTGRMNGVAVSGASAENLAAEPGRHGGLYLFLARLIAADHHGHLTIEEVPSGGLIFTIRLPLR